MGKAVVGVAHHKYFCFIRHQVWGTWALHNMLKLSPVCSRESFPNWKSYIICTSSAYTDYLCPLLIEGLVFREDTLFIFDVKYVVIILIWLRQEWFWIEQNIITNEWLNTYYLVRICIWYSYFLFSFIKIYLPY